MPEQKAWNSRVATSLQIVYGVLHLGKIFPPACTPTDGVMHRHPQLVRCLCLQLSSDITALIVSQPLGLHGAPSIQQLQVSLEKLFAPKVVKGTHKGAEHAASITLDLNNPVLFLYFVTS